MTTTGDRQSRTVVDLLRLLPFVLIITMFGVAVLIALVAPGRATSGVYQATVGEGPWWRTGEAPSIADVGLLSVLTGAVAGVAAYLLSKRARPEADESRFSIAVRTGLLGLAPFIAGSLLMASGRSALGLLGSVGLLLSPISPVLLASALLMAWRYQLGGAGGDDRGRRVGYAISATIVTAFYTTIALVVFLEYAEFINWT